MSQVTRSMPLTFVDDARGEVAQAREIVRRRRRQLKRILQPDGRALKKHARACVDAESAWLRCRKGLLNLSRRQGNAVEPQQFVSCLERQPLDKLIFDLQAGFPGKGGLIGRGVRGTNDLLEAHSGRLLGVIVVEADLDEPLDRKPVELE